MTSFPNSARAGLSPRDPSVRRKRTAAVMLAGACAFITLYAPQPLLPMLAAAFHKSAASVSFLVTASTIAVAFAAPLTGALAERLGRKRVIVPAAFLMAIPSLMSATARGFGELLFWRCALGLLTPGIFVVTVAYINEEWEEGAGAAMAAYVTGTVLGGFFGRALAAVTAHYSWRAAFFLLGLLSLAGAVCIRAWLPPGRRFKKYDGGSTTRAMARHLRNPRLLATYAVGFCVFSTLLATFTYVNFYLAAPPFGLSTAALGLLFTVYLVGAVVTPYAGRAIDRVGHRAALATAFTGGVAGISLTLIHSLPAVLAGLALCCTSVFVAQSSANSYIGIAARESRAAAVGLYVMFYYAGGSIGTIFTGICWSHGGWPACVAVIAGVQAATIALALLFWEPAPAGDSSAIPMPGH
jgi:MFS transporter, YNFM family, putative membrane transport protein